MQPNPPVEGVQSFVFRLFHRGSPHDRACAGGRSAGVVPAAKKRRGGTSWPTTPPRRAPVRMSRKRSGSSVIQSDIDIKSWHRRMPTVAEARPAACPECKAASCPVGGRLQLHGHGLRERQVCGPPAPDEAPVALVLAGRRYRCVRCRATLLVVPRGVLPRRQYSAAALGLALALWGLVRATALEVRRRVSPAKELGINALLGWVTLRRWTKAVRRRDLFAKGPSASPSATLRDVAAVAATALAASAAPTTRHLPLAHRAFFGAAHAA